MFRWFKDGAELKPGDVYQLSGSKSLGNQIQKQVWIPGTDFKGNSRALCGQVNS